LNRRSRRTLGVQVIENALELGKTRQRRRRDEGAPAETNDSDRLNLPPSTEVKRSLNYA
jgi:hypothetical protein